MRVRVVRDKRSVKVKSIRCVHADDDHEGEEDFEGYSKIGGVVVGDPQESRVERDEERAATALAKRAFV